MTSSPLCSGCRINSVRLIHYPPVCEYVDVLAPFLVEPPFLFELFNRSLLQGAVHTVFKSAYIMPLLKKPDLDPAENKSYRPISNQSVLSITLKRLVARQLVDYLCRPNA